MSFTQDERTYFNKEKVLSEQLRGLVLCIGLLVMFVALEYGSTLWIEPNDLQGAKSYKYQLDLRTATAAELQVIPGFGDTLSVRWINERQSLLQKYNDPLVALSHMKGIGQQKLEMIRPYALPVDPPKREPNFAQRFAEAAE